MCFPLATKRPGRACATLSAPCTRGATKASREANMRHGRLWGDDDGCVFLGTEKEKPSTKINPLQKLVFFITGASS